MKTTHKKRTWAMVATFVVAISIVATAANINLSPTSTDFPPVAETEQTLENWMGDPTYLEDVIADSDITLEDWMVDPTYLDDVIDEDTPIELEDWMGDPNYLI